MRQKRRLELIKDFDYDFKDHLDKANIVVDAFNRKVFLS